MLLGNGSSRREYHAKRAKGEKKSVSSLVKRLEKGSSKIFHHSFTTDATRQCHEKIQDLRAASEKIAIEKVFIMKQTGEKNSVMDALTRQIGTLKRRDADVLSECVRLEEKTKDALATLQRVKRFFLEKMRQYNKTKRQRICAVWGDLLDDETKSKILPLLRSLNDSATSNTRVEFQESFRKVNETFTNAFQQLSDCDCETCRDSMPVDAENDESDGAPSPAADYPSEMYPDAAPVLNEK